jgi:hypothetical protein
MFTGHGSDMSYVPVTFGRALVSRTAAANYVEAALLRELGGSARRRRSILRLGFA